MDPNFVCFLTYFGDHFGVENGPNNAPKLGPRMDLKKWSRPRKEAVLAHLEIGPGRVLCFKMQVFGVAVSVIKGVNMTDKGVIERENGWKGTGCGERESGGGCGSGVSWRGERKSSKAFSKKKHEKQLFL